MRYCCLFALLFCAQVVGAQNIRGRIHFRVNIGDTTQTHQLILLDYSKLVGNATRLTKDTLYFRMHAAVEETAIPNDKVRYLGDFAADTRPRPALDDTPGFADLTYERTALPFHSRGQLKIIEAIYFGSEFNLNDNIQIGAGLAPAGLLLTQRLRYSITPNLHVGLSNQTVYFPFFSSFDNPNQSGIFVGDATAIVTFGTSDRFLNIGTGLFYNTDVSGERIWLQRGAVGGRIGRYWHGYVEALVSLNSTFDELELYPSVNASYGKRRHRWKFGVFSVLLDRDSFFVPPIPYIGYSLYW